jgi:hypothetical protein
MSNTTKPTGGQPVNLSAETSATRPGVIRMQIEIPADFNAVNALVAIADHCSALVQAAEAKRDKADELDAAGNEREAEALRRRATISPETLRDINHRLIFLAMRLSGCSITINPEAAR